MQSDEKKEHVLVCFLENMSKAVQVVVDLDFVLEMLQVAHHLLSIVAARGIRSLDDALGSELVHFLVCLHLRMPVLAVVAVHSSPLAVQRFVPVPVNVAQKILSIKVK